MEQLPVLRSGRKRTCKDRPLTVPTLCVRSLVVISRWVQGRKGWGTHGIVRDQKRKRPETLDEPCLEGFHMQPRALSTIVELDPGEIINRWYFHVPLTDVLLDLVEKDPAGKDVEKLSRIARSFAHDLLHIATLGGRLFWYEGLTPNMQRSEDLVAISVDTENYLMFLRTACDIVASACALFAVDVGLRGQVPSSSLRDLIVWARKNPQKIKPSFAFLHSEGHDWFFELRSLRDKLVHWGYDTVIFTDRIRLWLFLRPLGITYLRILRNTPVDDREKLGREPLLPLLWRFTQQLLALADAVCAAIIGEERPSMTHYLNGVYVPALHDISQYREPAANDYLKMNARCLERIGEYLNAIQCGFPNDTWWDFLVRLSIQFGAPPRLITGPNHNPKGQIESWKFLFDTKRGSSAILIKPLLHREEDYLAAVEELLEFATRTGAQSKIIVSSDVRAFQTTKGWPIEVVCKRDRILGANMIYELLSNQMQE